MSHFYYIHKDVGGDPDFYKPGVTVHPSNVVRGIQRKQSKKFVIDHLYFGRPSHIYQLESCIKDYYKSVSGKALLEWGNQTELFKVDIEELLATVDSVIKGCEFNIVKIPLKEPYHGTNQKTCPLNLPGEGDRWYFDQKVDELFGYTSQRTKIAPTRTAKNLFKNELLVSCERLRSC
jgi:hypothetical protein